MNEVNENVFIHEERFRKAKPSCPGLLRRVTGPSLTPKVTLKFKKINGRVQKTKIMKLKREFKKNAKLKSTIKNKK
jgi:hypothetical protein